MFHAKHNYRRFVLLALLALLLPIIAACGGTSPQGGGEAAATAPATGGDTAATTAPATGGDTAATTPPATGGETATMAPAGEAATTAAGGEAAATADAGTEATAATGGAAATTAAGGAAPASGGPPTGGAFHGAWPYQLPPTGHYNTFATNAILSGGIYHDLLEQPLALYKWNEDQYVPQLATAWEVVPPDTFRVTLREGAKWSDGSNVTAQDVVTTFNIRRLQSTVVWRYLASVAAEGNNTVVFKMKQPSTVVQRYVLREPIRAHSVYGQWATRAQELFGTGTEPTAEQLKPLRTEFEQFRPEQMVVSGPYQIDPASITEAQLTLNKVPTAWNANTVHFDRIVLYNGETPAITPVVLSKEVDYATHGFPPATENAFAQQDIRIIRAPTYSGPALYINYGDPKTKPLANPKVRQAIAMAINRAENGTVSLGESAKPAQYMAGAPDRVLERWVSKDALAKMNKYEYNQEQATKMLTDLGFKKEGDVWVSGAGERMEFELGFPAEFADWSAAGQNLATQLTNFGIKTTPRPVTFTQWAPDMENGRFQLGINAWGVGNPHPHFHYSQDLLRFNPPQAPGPGMGYQLKQTTESVGEVDFNQLVVDAAAGLEVEKQKAAVTKLATAFNELLPIIPLWERYGNNPSLENTRVTGWPQEGDPILINPPYADPFATILILTGQLKGVAQ